MSLSKTFQHLSDYAKSNSYNKLAREISRLRHSGDFSLSANEAQSIAQIEGFEFQGHIGAFVYPLCPISTMGRVGSALARRIVDMRVRQMAYSSPMIAGILTVAAAGDFLTNHSIHSLIATPVLAYCVYNTAQYLKMEKPQDNMIGLGFYPSDTDKHLSLNNPIERALFNENLNSRIRLMQYHAPKEKRVVARPRAFTA